MKYKTFILRLEDRSGHLLEVSKIISSHNANITRLSYNKVVDQHTVFIEVYADEKDIDDLSQELGERNYLLKDSSEEVDVLMTLQIIDIPGTVTNILQVFEKYDVNISYVNTQENNTSYQYCKIGLYAANSELIQKVLDEISTFCEITSINYDTQDKIIDNTVFYHNFAQEMKKTLSLTQKETNSFLNNSNKILQILEDKNENYFKTFNYIRKFANYTVDYKNDNFNPRISHKSLTDNTTIYMIEPPSGGNSYILESDNELLFVDSGFACYKDEMKRIFYELFPNFDNMNKKLILTHADMDHAGITDIFKDIYVSENTFINFKREHEGKKNFREENQLHEPYIKLDRIISKYEPPELIKLRILGNKTNEEEFEKIGEYNFNDLSFEVYESNGGHLKGEIILVEKDKKLVFTGDIFVNVKGFTQEQYDFNLLAPYLMGSVNTDSTKASQCRQILINKCKNYLLCPGHGEWIENN
ncbi:MAG: MBL fold metallo-hydrolase [Methanosphaera sp.]|uniref:MBL fold metallo-hydrolase n=1 Tax=Methanosphaera sp. TaxID=2666342 RepID=UPI002E7687F6|nr:MBL fold metallo-hydrolase [Methanosphaera sp.]MEE1118180.1 MBL fold metallo-hydrolase [Methanosphaera sp.]MEE3418399.1 MBL fold metallo-hydrolase [Methanosphaera sp.]